jgi:hypothetical protein
LKIQQERQNIDTGEMPERYQQFLKEYPGIELRVSLKYIAQYLNTTVPTLSRIRQRILYSLS